MLNENLLNQSHKFSTEYGIYDCRVVDFISRDLARVKISVFDKQNNFLYTLDATWNEGELSDRGFKV